MPAFRFTRSIQIHSDPETVFCTVSDFASWPKWSPWLLCDKHTTVKLIEDTTKVGGGYSWDGPVVGAGEMEHLELKPPSHDRQQGTMHAEVRFTRPWKSQSDVTFQVGPAVDSDGESVTRVDWQMDGSLPFFMFWMKSMMVSALSMDFDRGLRMLKECIETGKITSKIDVEGVTQLDPVNMIGLSAKASLQEIGPAMDQTISNVMERLRSAGVKPDGNWVSLYDHMDMKNQIVSYTSGMIWPEGSETPPGLTKRSLPACKAMLVSHRGAYEHLGNAWAAAHQNLRAEKIKPDGKLPGLEFYLNSPQDNTPAEELMTEVYVPVR